VSPIWEATPANGLEPTDIVTVVEQAPIVINQLAFPSVAFNHQQGVSSTTWSITHNLNFYPNVTVVDSAGTIVEGEITYTNRNSLVLNFQTAFSGNAYLS
jgi:hypothetical protein